MKEENISKVNMLIGLNHLIEKHRDKKFCNWHKADQDDFVAGYLNVEHMSLRVLYENEELDKENKKIKRENKELELRIEELNKYNKFEIMDI